MEKRKLRCVSCLPLPTAPVGARTSSSLSSSFDCVTSGSGATFFTSCSCSTRLRKAKIRWCNAAYSCPVSLELAWGVFNVQKQEKGERNYNGIKRCICNIRRACWISQRVLQTQSGLWLHKMLEMLSSDGERIFLPKAYVKKIFK